jgi:hypothetical protein
MKVLKHEDFNLMLIEAFVRIEFIGSVQFVSITWFLWDQAEIPLYNLY